jgi:hypothetical protein
MYDDECDEEDSDLEDDEEGDEEVAVALEMTVKELGEGEDEEVAVALEMTVTEMAIGDWARGRILDGWQIYIMGVTLQAWVGFRLLRSF